MKAAIFISASLILLASSCAGPDSISRAAKKELKAEQMKQGMADVKNLIESGNYIFSAQSVQPIGGQAIKLSASSYVLDSKNHVVRADLPYFGEGYASHYSNNSDVRFRGDPVDFRITEYEKRGNVSVHYTISGEQERFDVTMTIASTGFGTVTIISQSRQTISYYGYLREMPEDYKF
ncbi:MAG: DUF4251 domain-containing protein [Bacteroidales bacterium]|nr:DUF4251 domain-containing protein [Bacteroidales bacterium]